MRLRRTEDLAFAESAGIPKPLWLNLPEAPNRGYGTKSALFDKPDPRDEDVLRQLEAAIHALVLENGVAEVYAPAANGGHVDHGLTRAAVERALGTVTEAPTLYFYQELPYAVGRNALGWEPDSNWIPLPRNISDTLDAKLHGAACYASQLAFQFGGSAQMEERLRTHARSCAAHLGEEEAAELLWLAPVPRSLRSQVVRQVADQVQRTRETVQGRATLVACDGRDLSGKTTFSEELARAIRTRGVPTTVVHQDDFLRSRTERYKRGEWSPEGFYLDFWDYPALLSEVIAPARQGMSVRQKRRRLNFRTDCVERVLDIDIDRSGVLIVEGLFLLRPELASAFDIVIRLHVDNETMVRRALDRDVPSMGAEGHVRRHYEDVVLPAQVRYEEQQAPDRRAHFVIDNSDSIRPRILAAA